MVSAGKIEYGIHKNNKSFSVNSPHYEESQIPLVDLAEHSKYCVRIFGGCENK